MNLQLPLSIEIVALLAAVARIGGFVAGIPGLTTGAVPMRLRAALILAVTLALAPALPPAYVDAAAVAVTPGAQALLIGSELLLGLTTGYGARLLMEIVAFAGALIDRDIGYAMTSAFDPSIEESTSIVSQFFVRLFLVLFVTLDGHLELLRTAGVSFHTIAPGSFLTNATVTESIIHLFGRVLSDGFCLSLPVFAIILLSNIVMALMARFGQEFEIMMLSFPIRLGLGIFTLIAMIPVMVLTFTSVSNDILNWADFLVR